MSKTDKDRPYFIRAFFEGDLEHNHTSGECRPADLGEGSRRWRWNHNCTKYETIEYACPGFNAGQRNEYNYRSGPAATCYTMRREYDAAYREIERGDYRRGWLLAVTWRKSRFCGETHTYRKFHRDWACEECDTRPTCYRSLGWRERPYSHVPSEWVNRVWTRPERRRTRDELIEIRKDFNTNFGYADTEFDNPQHRHGAAWDYY